MSSPQTDK